MRRTLIALALALSLGAPAAFAHDDGDEKGGSISKVNGGITAEAGQQYRDLETVNGGIRLRARAVAEDVETVNGGITIEDDVQVRSVATVNGGISAGERVQVSGDAETVNGGLRFDFNSRIGGDLGTVNGGITIKQSQVDGQVHTVSGDITIGAKSVVRGGIWVERPSGLSFGRQRAPRIVIGPDATVQGALRFDREVELFVHPSAKIGTVTGAKVQTWTTTLPPRND
jgi:hypothetical protein